MNENHFQIGRPSDARRTLAAGHVDIWRIPLDRDCSDILSDCLAEDELNRASRFLAEIHRRRYRNGRIAVRQLLGHYLGIAPDAIEFGYTPLGKPFLKTPPSGVLMANANVHFNFSNSADWGLFAITLEHEIGVDLECVRPMSDMEGLARRFFAPAEIDAIITCDDPSQRQQVFFRCWTRKEAFLKAVGQGLSFPLEKVCVTSLPQDAPEILWIDNDNFKASSWALRHLDPAPGYLGALAAPTRNVTVQLFDFQSSS